MILRFFILIIWLEESLKGTPSSCGIAFVNFWPEKMVVHFQKTKYKFYLKIEILSIFGEVWQNFRHGMGAIFKILI